LGLTLDGGNVCPEFSPPERCGVVYKIDTAGHEMVLFAFTGGDDGAVPYGGVVRDAAGNLYGTAQYGGTTGRGVVFKLYSLAAFGYHELTS
jgi:uncharacterized repeat protein (TIGR03803 family)